MMLDLQEVAAATFDVPLNGDSVAGSQTLRFHKVVRVRLIRSSARAWIRLDLCLSRLAIVDELECLSFLWKKGESILQYQNKILLLFFRGYLLGIDILLRHSGPTLLSAPGF
jgi:hypothetical protein